MKINIKDYYPEVKTGYWTDGEKIYNKTGKVVSSNKISLENGKRLIILPENIAKRVAMSECKLPEVQQGKVVYFRKSDLQVSGGYRAFISMQAICSNLYDPITSKVNTNIYSVSQETLFNKLGQAGMTDEEKEQHLIN